MRTAVAVLLLIVAPACRLSAQTYGDIVGRVRESGGRRIGLGGARVAVAGTVLWAVTDYKGRYRIHAVPVGRQSVTVQVAGYVAGRRDDVPVLAGEETGQDFFLSRDATAGVAQVPEPALDPRGWSGTQHLDGAALAVMPVLTIADVGSLWSEGQEQTYSAGRRGAEQLSIDGTTLRNPYDGSTAPLGLRVPTGMLEDASLARDPGIGVVGLSGVQRLILVDGGARWHGLVGYQTDRPFSGPADIGFDRLTARAEGPLGSARVVAMVDGNGRLQAEPLSAPRGDPRTPAPWELGHNAGEWIDGAAKLSVPLGLSHTLQVLAIRSMEQRSLFDLAFKYDPGPGAGQRITATLVVAQVRLASPRSTMVLRAHYLARDFIQSDLEASPPYKFGALGGSYSFLGQDIARARDTAAARSASPGFVRPDFAVGTPWGVAGFFLQGGSHGSLLWNEYREFQTAFDFTVAPTRLFTLSGDAGFTVARVQAFQRVLGSLPVGDSVPPATSAELSPLSLTAAVRAEGHVAGGTLAASLRANMVSPGVAGASRMATSLSPRLDLSIPVGGSLLSVAVARITRFPDLQFISDVSFDDARAGGRFRHGDPDLGFETVGLIEVQFGLRVRHDVTLHALFYARRFDDLVASTPSAVADSSAFGNRDRLSVTGGEVKLDKQFGRAGRVTLSYVAEDASFEAVDGFSIATGTAPTTSDFLSRFILTARGALPGGFDAGGVVRVTSAAPFSLIPSDRNRNTVTIDALLRRSVHVRWAGASVFVEGRNLLNTRTLVAVRRATGTVMLDSAGVENLAQAAYAANPGSIPYDSPRYRPFADLDANGSIEGPGELLPLYRQAAADFSQPLQAYGPLRSVRLGIEISF